MSYLTANSRTSSEWRFSRALLLACLAHLVLALALPELPELTIPSVDRGRGITVFLRATPEPEEFKQSLENPGLLNNELVDNKPTAGQVPTQAGDEEQNTDAAPDVSSEREDSSLANPSGSQADAGLNATAFISRATIQVFAQQDAYRHAEQNPDALQRFQRSFRSLANYRRRSRSDSYTDRYGDYYVRTSSSSGDICFKQEKELQPDDFSTNTVMFFSCERGPLKLALGREKAAELEEDLRPSTGSEPIILPR